MNSFQDTQSDLEVILEFLEEYYRQNTAENGVPVHERSVSVNQTRDQPWSCLELSDSKPAFQTSLAHNVQSAYGQNTTATLSEHGSLPNFVSTRQSAKHPAAVAGRVCTEDPSQSLKRFFWEWLVEEKNNSCPVPAGRKLRLFHFLFEMLEDPSMAHCLSWVPAAAGVFRFSSRNKDQVAVLWGQRKGNKRPMTYQKMSRALRNYARTGHIFKVKKKLTYQFGRDTLTSLQKFYGRDF